jgi:hippurate hydrolase
MSMHRARTLSARLGVGLVIVLAPLAAAAQQTIATPGATTAGPASVEAKALSKTAEAAIEADTPRLTEVFKDIHQHPEFGFMESRTAAIVARELTALGFEVQTGIGKTGVVGILRNGAGPTVMYRADMDANAVEEVTGLPYASKVRVKREDGVEVPVAHLCGHDVHVTWLLGMAKGMAAIKPDWNGTLVLVGQPAEEPITGAKAMVDDGCTPGTRCPFPTTSSACTRRRVRWAWSPMSVCCAWPAPTRSPSSSRVSAVTARCRSTRRIR